MYNLRCKHLGNTYSEMRESEKEVSEFLDSLGLNWVFESPIFVYDEKERPRVWTPDFYVPKLGIFIEVCGSEDFKYEYREKIYRKNGFYVVFLHHYKEKEKWKTYVLKRIMEIEEQRHAEVMKVVNSVISHAL
jgi:hypothetical protein